MVDHRTGGGLVIPGYAAVVSVTSLAANAYNGRLVRNGVPAEPLSFILDPDRPRAYPTMIAQAHVVAAALDFPPGRPPAVGDGDTRVE